jgi:hypothetical protein
MPLLPWHEVEHAILKEERWLNEVFDFGPYSHQGSTPIPPNLSSDKMLRQIAIAIVNGTIQAREILAAEENSLWLEPDARITQLEPNERHGGHWHQSMMSNVKKHFINTGFEVINEPYLSLGRADLGVYKDGYPDLFVEIGTTSLFKTWFNTKTMTDSIFLFVPTTAYAIELKTTKTT